MGYCNIDTEQIFSKPPRINSRLHKYQLFKKTLNNWFFSHRVIDRWNNFQKMSLKK